MNHSMPGLPVHHHLLEFTQTHVHRVSDAIQPSHPLSSLFLLSSIPPSIRVFSNESTLHMRWPKYWSFSFSIIPSKEHPGLISFRIDWLDLLEVQRDSQVFSNTTMHILESQYTTELVLNFFTTALPGKPRMLLLLLLSRFSRVRLCVTPYLSKY